MSAQTLTRSVSEEAEEGPTVPLLSLHVASAFKNFQIRLVFVSEFILIRCPSVWKNQAVVLL